MKYFKYYCRLFSMCFMDQLANRTNFITWGLILTLMVTIHLIFFKLIFGSNVIINGWSQAQVLSVYGTAILVRGLGSLTFFSFMYRFSDDIRNGAYDFKLLKPMNPHFLAAIPYIDLEDIMTIPLSLIVIFYSFPGFNILNLLMYLILIFAALTILFSIITLIESTAFKTINVNSATDGIWSLVNSAYYPMKATISFIPQSVIFLFPAILLSSIPAEVLFGRYEWNWILASVIMAGGLFIISRKVFQNALRDYSSASS